MADADVRVASGDSTPKPTPQSSTDSKTKPDANILSTDPSPPRGDIDEEDMAELSPMRTHEQQGHEAPIADRFHHLVDDSDEDDDDKEATVNHEKLERKELKRQKTNDKPNRLRDRLKRTVSKAAE
jgi:hypothetical protein